MTRSTERVRPWYREPYVWLVIAFPASAVFGGIVTTLLAVSSFDGLVVDDYYKRGLEINRVFERDRNATRGGFALSVELDSESRSILVTLSTFRDAPFPATADLNITHATRPGLDFETTIYFDTPHHKNERQHAASRLHDLSFEAGHWYIQLAGDDWRVVDEIWIR